MELNNEQYKAVNTSDSNILVSAGAGSGKTGVLSERVFRILCDKISRKKPYMGSLERLLVLTFTDNAAFNMKSRIKKVIKEKLDAFKKLKEKIKTFSNNNDLNDYLHSIEGYSTLSELYLIKRDENYSFEKNALLIKINEKEEHLQSQSNLIDSAEITTFDSFYQKIIKRYFYLTSIPKTFEIVDETILNSKLYDIITEKINEEFEKGDQTFLGLVGKFTLNDPKNLIQLLYSAVIAQKKLKSNEKSIDQLAQCKKLLLSQIPVFYKKIFNEFKNQIKSFSFGIISINNSDEKIKDLIGRLKNCIGDYSKIGNIDTALKIYNEIKKVLFKQTLKSTKKFISGGDELFELKNNLYNACDDFINIISEDQCKVIIDSNSDYVNYLFSIALDINEKFEKFKYDKAAYTFSDFKIAALKLIKEHPSILQEIKDSYDEILADECQDNDDFQNELLDLISDNNLFMVGDIKQSIYLFRNANPSLFLNRLNRYKNNSGGILIEMNKNYRSLSNVINSVNGIFQSLMTRKFGNIDYFNGHNLSCGKREFFIEKDNQKSEIESKIYAYLDSKNYDNFENKKGSDYFAEAKIIAEDIKKRVGKEYIRLKNRDEKKDKKIKDVLLDYKDFCILCDKGSNFDIVAKVFLYYGIPLKIDVQSDFLNEILVKVLANLMLLYCYIAKLILYKDASYINSNSFKHVLVSILRSPFILIKNEELIDLFEKSKVFSDFNEIKEQTAIKLIIDTINDCKYKNIHEVFIELIEKFNFARGLINFTDSISANVYLDAYEKIISNLANLNYSLDELISYFKNVLNNFIPIDLKSKIKVVNSISNAVLITNIHQSKGLEYNIVYCIGLCNKFNLKNEFSSNFYYSNELGFVLPLTIFDFNDKDANNLNYVLPFTYFLNKENKMDNLEEKARLFYVELTRPVFQFILLAPYKGDDSGSVEGKDLGKLKFINLYNKTNSNGENSKDGKSLDKAESFYDFMCQTLINFDIKLFDIDIPDFVSKVKKQLSSNISKINNVQNNENKIEYKCLPEEVIKIFKSNKNTESNTASFKASNQNAIELQNGTLLHAFLESLGDLNNPDFSMIEDYDKINPSGIYGKKISQIAINFLNSDLIKKYKSFDTYHEFPYYDDELKSQGFIDLLLVNKAEKMAIIIDFKTKDISNEHYPKQLGIYKQNVLKILGNDFNVNAYLYSINDNKFEKVC